MTDTHKTAVAVIEKHDLPETLHPMVRAALAQSPDAGTLRELLAVQREWEAGEAKRAYTRALVELKRDLPTVIAHDKRVDYTTAKGRTYYSHSSLAALVDAVTECLTRYGFSISWHPSTGPNGVTVACRLTHAAGHSEEASISAPVDTSGNKSPAQGVASTITLLSRYTAAALLGIATKDMSEEGGRRAGPGPSTQAVDSEKTLHVIGVLLKRGKTVQDAESVVGAKVKDWTLEDLHDIKEWLRNSAQSQQAAFDSAIEQTAKNEEFRLDKDIARNLSAGTQASGPPAVSYAGLYARIERARDPDLLAADMELIPLIEGEADKLELHQMAELKLLELRGQA